MNPRWSRIGVVAFLSVTMTVLPAKDRETALPRVLLKTSVGAITIEVDRIRAPITSCNFLRYVGDGYYDGGHFVRTVKSPAALVQAAARHPVNRYSFDAYGPIPLEPTSMTGLSHVAGTVSMVRESAADSATSGFFIVLDDIPALNEGGHNKPDGKGFAAFGRVVAGMPVVRAIHRARTERNPVGRKDVFAGDQWLNPPIRILSATLIAGEGCGCAAVHAGE